MWERELFTRSWYRRSAVPCTDEDEPPATLFTQCLPGDNLTCAQRDLESGSIFIGKNVVCVTFINQRTDKYSMEYSEIEFLAAVKINVIHYQDGCTNVLFFG